MDMYEFFGVPRTFKVLPNPGLCSCGGQGINWFDGNMFNPTAVYVICGACGKEGPRVTDRDKHSAGVEAVRQWNEMHQGGPIGGASA